MQERYFDNLYLENIYNHEDDSTIFIKPLMKLHLVFYNF